MRLIFLLSCVILFLGCSTSFEETLHTTLKLSANEMNSIQELEGTFKVVNGTSETKTIEFATGCHFVFTIEKDGKEVFNSLASALCTQEITVIEIAPYKEIEFQISISQEFELEPGKYELKAFLIGHDDLKSSKTFTLR